MNLYDNTITLYLLTLITIVLTFVAYYVILHNKKTSNPQSDLKSKDDDLDTSPKLPSDRIEKGDSLFSGIALFEEGELEKAELMLLRVLDSVSESSEKTLKCELRYYLAKINLGMGDLTLACEHWQIARELYEEVGNSEKTKEIEQQMRDNGCPTEWVLNAF